MISPFIANMTLDGLEAAVDASMESTQRARRKFKINVDRYTTDFVVTEASKVILEHNKQLLIFRGLELSEKKTRVAHIADGSISLGSMYASTAVNCSSNRPTRV